MRGSPVALALLLGVAGCGGGSSGGAPDPGPLARLAPSAAASVLSPGNASGQDEDPSIVRARDGSLYVAWYSNRNGLQTDGREDKEIFLMRSGDGATWTDPPIQLTRDPAFAFYPSLAQDAAGAFHLAWWRVIPTGPGTDNRILYKSSPDGVTWDADQGLEIASGPGDWLPALVADRAGGRLLVYFSAVARDRNGAVNLGERILRLHVAIRDAAGAWAAPAPLQGVNEDATHNTYPHVLQRAGGSFVMTWTRYDAAQPNDVLQVIQEPSTVTMLSTSADGVAWTPPVAMSEAGAAIDVFPSLFADPADRPFVLWTTTAFGAPVTAELAAGASYPGGVVQRPEISGYTARLLATPTPGIFWSVWVEGPAGTQKVRHRFLAR